MSIVRMAALASLILLGGCPKKETESSKSTAKTASAPAPTQPAPAKVKPEANVQPEAAEKEEKPTLEFGPTLDNLAKHPASKFNDLAQHPMHALTQHLQLKLLSVKATKLSDLWGKKPSELPGLFTPMDQLEVEDLRPRLKAYEVETGIKDKKRKKLLIRWWFIDDQLYSIRLRLRTKAKKLFKKYTTAAVRGPDRVGKDRQKVEDRFWVDGNIMIGVHKKYKNWALSFSDRARGEIAHQLTERLLETERNVERSHYLFKGRKTDLGEVISLTTMAVQEYPMYGDAWVNLCHAQYDMGNLHEASKSCSKAIEVTREKTVKGKARYHLGLIELVKSNKAAGMLLLEQAMQGLTKNGYYWVQAKARRWSNQGKRGKYTMKKAYYEDQCYSSRGEGARFTQIPREFGFRNARSLRKRAMKVLDDPIEIQRKAAKRCAINYDPEQYYDY